MPIIPTRHLKITLNMVLWCLTPLLALQNVILMKQEKDYRTALYPPLVGAGAHLGHLVASNMAGVRTEIALPAQHSNRFVIITMSPGCPICRDNERTYMAISKALEGKEDWRVVWVSRDSLETTRRYFLPKSAPWLNVLAEPTNGTYSALSLYAVPNMIVTGSDGVVQKAWSGHLVAGKCQDISRFFGISYDALTSL